MAQQSGPKQLAQGPEAGLSHVAFSLQMVIGILKDGIDHSQANNRLADTKVALASLSVGDASITTAVDGGPVILSPSLSHTALKDHIGASFKDLVVRAGEEVTVFAWADQEKVAIAYNPKSDQVGMISTMLLKRNPDAAQNDTRVWFANRSNIPQDTKPKNVADDWLTLERGHYVVAYNINRNTWYAWGPGTYFARGDFRTFKLDCSFLETVRKPGTPV